MSNIYPGPPTNLSATSGNGQVVVSFTPGSNGGSPITNYQYSINGGSTFTAFSPADSASPVTIRGLTNGTTYSIALRAVNINGVGTSSETISATPMTIPQRPIIDSITPGNTQATIYFTPGNNGGSAITNYEYSFNGGSSFTAFSSPVTQSPVTITGLSNGITYSFMLRAVNEKGKSAPSFIFSTIPSTEPSAPTNLIVKSGNGQAFVSFTPGHNGGSRIINYQYSFDGGTTFTAFSPAVTGSFVIISGLTNGTTYSIALKAVNVIGAGESSTSVSMTPYTVPSAPTELSISSSNLELTLSFNPGYNGGTAITNYQYSLDGGINFRTFVPPITQSPVTITGLTNGVTYSVALRAMNERGIGATSAIVLGTPSTIPSAPKDLVATHGDQELYISFNLEYNGGIPITNYEYSIDGGAFTAFSPVQTTPPLTITGLTNGTIYDIALKAVNATGTGPASTTVSGMPSTTPSAPTELSVSNYSNEVDVSFTPGTDGGLPITNYEYSIDGGITFEEFIPAITTSPVSILNLINGITYSIVLRAVNENGSGIPSGPVSASPSTTPDQPYITSATHGDQEVSITFSQDFDGGSPITNYEYSIDDGNTFTAFSSAVNQSPITIGGLTNGTMYDIIIRGVNANGIGANSEIVSIIPSTTPDQPTGLSAIPANGSVTITFSEGFDGGATITNYEYSIDNGTTFTEFVPQVTTSPVFISGLQNGTTYSIVLRAINQNGPGTSSTAITVTPSTIPLEPEVTSVTTGNKEVLIDFIPGNDGGNLIINYEYSIDNGINYITFEPAVTQSPITISGLFNGTSYDILLRAINIVGAGLDAYIFATLPISVPEKPNDLSATFGDQQVIVSFVAGHNGGSDITNYEYSIDNGSTFTAFSSAVTESPVTITGLTNGTTYNIVLRAVNEIGPGTASTAVSVTPSTTPGQPTNLSAISGDQQTIISFVPGNNGGTEITNYEYSIDNGSTFTAFSPVQTSTPVTITGLTNGSTYNIALRAVNANGPGTASTAVSVIPESSLFGVYVVGSYVSNPAEVYNSSNQKARDLTNAGTAQDAFLVKYSLSGKVLWSSRLSSTTGSAIDICRSVATDTSGNVYICGQCDSDTIIYDSNNTAVPFSAPGTGGSFCFIIKYDSSGSVLWSASAGTTTAPSGGFAVSANGISVDSSGNVHVTGQYIRGGTFTVYNSNGGSSGITRANSATTGTETHDCFIIKYDTNGTALWGARIAGTSAQDFGNSIVVDNSSNVYVTGAFNSTITIYSASDTAYTPTLSRSSTTGSSCFIVKYNSSGVVQWITRINSPTFSSVFIFGSGIKVDSSGNVYVCGLYDGDARLFNQPGSSSTLTNLTDYGVNNTFFIAKYDTNGTGLWRAPIVYSSVGIDLSMLVGMDIDSSNNIYLTGRFAGTLTPRDSNDASTLATITSSGADCFVIKYEQPSNTSATATWATRISGSSTEIGYGISVDISGNVYVTGSFQSSSITAYTSADATTSVTLSNSDTGATTTDCFIVKYKQNASAPLATPEWAGRIGGSNNEIGYGVGVYLQ